MEILMTGRVGQAECHKCYIKFPKNEMKQIEVKDARSGSSMSSDLGDLSKGKFENIRFNEGRQYYRQAWICKDCQGAEIFGGKGCGKVAGKGCLWFFLALTALVIFLDPQKSDTGYTSSKLSSGDKDTVPVPDTASTSTEANPIKNIQPKFGNISTNVIPLVRIEPRYPTREKILRFEGWVKVQFTITKEGTVTDAIVVDSVPKNTFDRAALSAIKRWKFKPKIIDGMAFEQRAEQLFEFKLTK
jgi:TonB family protein